MIRPSSEELVLACLERIVEREDVVRAWAHLDAAAALTQARARDREPPRSPLHGVPVGVKDVIDTADLPTQRGTPIHAGRRPAADAACVARLRAAGCVVLGKTVTTELATWKPGPTANPHDPRCTPGGSSSGSAAAVADGMVPLALGTQTVGSTIRPAAFCGVWGFKPTHGLLPLDGVLPLSAALDTLGLFAGRLEDLVALLEALGGPAPAAPPEHPRVALIRTPWWDRAEPATQRAVEGAAARLEAAGADIGDVDAAWLEPLLDAHGTVTEYEVARTLRADRDRVSDVLRALVDRGLALSDEQHARALALARDGQARLASLFSRHGAILTPAVPGEAPIGLNSTGDPLFCRVWTLLGAPAVAVPAGMGPHGLPVGVQLVGCRGGDANLLALAAHAAPIRFQGAQL